MALLSPDFEDIVAILSLFFSITAILLALPQVRNILSYLWLRIKIRDIFIILGPKRAGKTSLIGFLRLTGVPESYEHTFNWKTYGPLTFDIGENQTHFLYSKKLVDIGGERKAEYELLIKNENPKGIIFVVDNTIVKEGQTITDRHNEEISDFERIYSVYNGLDWKPNKIRLKTILILINKADLWDEHSETKRDSTKDHYKTLFGPTLAKFSNEFGDRVEFIFEYVELGRKFHYGDENNDALLKFARSMTREIEVR